MTKKLSFDQSEEENKRNFIAMLVAAGWTETEAAAEWEDIQNDEEGCP